MGKTMGHGILSKKARQLKSNIQDILSKIGEMDRLPSNESKNRKHKFSNSIF